MSKLLKLNQQVQTCRLCRLCRGRIHGVPGEGNDKAEIMFIGEGPGFHEDNQGRPFVGPAGQFLDELLEVAGLKRADVYITNVVKCRPPQNRDPLPDEIDACGPYLERQMALIDPLVVVTLGRYSMGRFFPNDRITAVAGQARYQDGRLVVTMLHPAYALRNVEAKDQMRDAFRKLPQFVEQARRDRANRQDAPQKPVDDATFAAIVEQRLSEIEQRLKETAPPPPPQLVRSVTPVDPYAYTAGVNGARKARKAAPKAEPVPQVEIAADPDWDTPLEIASVEEAAPVAEVDAPEAEIVVAPSAEVQPEPVAEIVAAPEIEAQPEPTTEVVAVAPQMPEAVAEAESVAQEAVPEAIEPVAVAPEPEPKLRETGTRRGRKAEAAPMIVGDAVVAGVQEPQQAYAATEAELPVETLTVAPAPEAQVEQPAEGEQAAQPAAAKGRKKAKPEPEVKQLSLF